MDDTNLPDPTASGRLRMDRRLRMSIILKNVVLVFMLVAAAGVGFAFWMGWLHPTSGPGFPPSPPQLSGALPDPPIIATAPLRDPWRLSYAVAAAFLSVMVLHANVSQLVAKAFRRRVMSWSAALYAAVQPAWGQPSLRASTLTAGAIGICLWYFGTAALSRPAFDQFQTLVMPIQALALWAYMMVCGSVKRVGKAALSTVNMWFVLYVAVSAARWAV